MQYLAIYVEYENAEPEISVTLLNDLKAMNVTVLELTTADLDEGVKWVAVRICATEEETERFFQELQDAR